MASKVPGQWVLSDDEVAALTTTREQWFMFRAEAAVDEYSLRRIVATVNQKRLGDPPGVVRRRDDGALATRRQDATGALYWRAPINDQSEVDDSWQVIFPMLTFCAANPEDGWRSMSFESDFADQEAV